MKKEYNVGDDVPLSFQVLVNGKPVTPLFAKGMVFNSKSELVFEDKCRIQGSNVSFMVKKDKKAEPGEFTVVFAVTLRDYGRKNYVLKYTLHPLPVTKAIRDKLQRGKKNAS